MKIKKFPVLIITILTLILLGFGVFYPMITITMDTTIDAKLVSFDNRVIESTRSILGTAKELYLNQRYLVSFLIFFFSIIIPLAKTVLFLVSFYVQKESRLKIETLLEKIGKWSMADVFVVAIFLAYLATNGHIESSSRVVQVLAMKLNVNFSANMQTTLEPGFYFFLSYCLISMACSQIFKASLSEEES